MGGYNDLYIWKKYKIQNNIEIVTNKENVNKYIYSNLNFFNEFATSLKEKKFKNF